MSRFDLTQYDEYEDEFNPLIHDRQARRARKPKAKHIPKKAAQQVIGEVAATEGLEGGFKTTYQPARFEEGWLLESLRSFYDQTMIEDVLARVKGGKEASVYRCATHPAFQALHGIPLLAAKVYRPRQFRNLRNDKMYREGRAILNEGGRIIKKSDQRIMRALNKKSDFGAQVAHTSWLMYEVNTLKTLQAAGAAVPTAYGVNENSILMTYYGDEDMAAPTLNDVELDRDEALPLLNEALRNIELMLSLGIIHGDLSAYNLLYWEGKIVLIDFPQVVSPDANPHAREIFTRDVERICEYFTAQGVKRDGTQLADRLWRRFAAKDARLIKADFSRFAEADEE